MTRDARLHSCNSICSGMSCSAPHAFDKCPGVQPFLNCMFEVYISVCISVCLYAANGAAHGQGLSPDQQVAAWILQHYASLSFKRALTHTDLAALEKRAGAGGHSPAAQSQAWDDFQDWFCKTIKALKQVCRHILCGLVSCSSEVLPPPQFQMIHRL